MIPTWAALGLGLALTASAAAQVTGSVALTGEVQAATSLTTEQLAALPQVTVQAAREGGATASYGGPLLWPLVVAARPVDGPDRGSHLQHVLVARGADGYAVALAFGEIDPGFEGKPVIIALRQDEAALPAPRLVVPGDHRAGRNVRDLRSVEIR